MDHNHYRKIFEKIFSYLATDDHHAFFQHLDNKVIFIAPGHHLWSGIYHGAHEVQSHAFEDVNRFLRAPIKYKMLKILVEGNCAFITMNGEATSNCGKPYNNHYCFYVEMNKEQRISKIEVFYDTALVLDLIKENTPHRKTA